MRASSQASVEATLSGPPAGRFAGRTAIVTGASGGLGSEVAARLVHEGASVGLLGRNRDALDRVVGAMPPGAAGRALPVVADVTDALSVERGVGEVVAAFGRLDLLAHTAGVLRRGRAVEQSEADWDLTFDTNAKSCFLLARSVVPHLRAASGGAIVNVASVFALSATENASVYAASKAAVVAFTKVLALEHARDGIRVNSVAPGTMDTPMLRSAVAVDALTRIERLHPTGRLVSPGEVASLVLYLLSDEAAAVAGSCYVVDGGRLAKLGSADAGS